MFSDLIGWKTTHYIGGDSLDIPHIVSSVFGWTTK